MIILFDFFYESILVSGFPHNYVIEFVNIIVKSYGISIFL